MSGVEMKRTRTYDDEEVAVVYDRHVTLRGSSLAATVAALLPDRGGRAVDLGCGTGYFSTLLAARYEEVLAVDAAAPMVNHASRTRPRPNIRYEVRDLDALSPDADGQFDLVLTINALHHVPDYRATLTLIRSLVAPGGLAVIIDVVSDRPRSRAWWLGRAMALVPRDALRRGPRVAAELLRVRVHPAWLNHVASDVVQTLDQFREHCRAAFGTGVVVVEAGRDAMAVWAAERAAAENAPERLAAAQGTPQWRRRSERTKR